MSANKSEAVPGADLLPGRRLDGWVAPHVVIWTLRRCAATALETVFWGSYDWGRFVCDPFSQDKRLGHVGARLAEEPDRLDFYRGSSGLFSAPVVLRQQLEMISRDGAGLLLSTAILQRAVHVVLYRRNELKRLESMLVAQSTGYWGDGPPGEHAARIQRGEIEPKSVDLEPFFHSSRFGIDQLRRVRGMLHGAELPFTELCMEDLFARDNTAAVEEIRDVLARKDLRRTAEEIDSKLRTSMVGHRSSRLLARYAPDLERFRAIAATRPELEDIAPLVRGGRGESPHLAGTPVEPKLHPDAKTRPSPLAALRSILPQRVRLHL